MKKIIIFGNSASGKSTLAKRYHQAGLAHLDLDTIAWDMTPAPVRKSLAISQLMLDEFCRAHESWVIEGCYSDLLEYVATRATHAIFMNIGVEACIKNARERPFEPHKYATKAEQDENLEMLIAWIKDYETRDDTFSLSAHKSLYSSFIGKKEEYTRVTVYNG